MLQQHTTININSSNKHSVETAISIINMGDRRRTTSLAFFDDELAALVVQAAAATASDSDPEQQHEHAISNAPVSTTNDENNIVALLQVLSLKKNCVCDEHNADTATTTTTTTTSAVEDALLELYEYSAVALLHANALPVIAQYLQNNDATDTSIALLKSVVEEKCADLPYPHCVGLTTNEQQIAVGLGFTDANALLERFTRILDEKTSSSKSSDILYCLFYFVAYGKVRMATRKTTLHAILSSMKHHWQQTELQYHGSRLLMAILDQDLSLIDTLGSAAVKVLPNALKRVYAATVDGGCDDDDDDDPEPTVFALRSLLMILAGNDKAKQSFLASPWRAQVADTCLTIIAVAPYGTLLHCALNLLAVTIEDCKDLQTMVVHSKHLPVFARLLKKYTKCQTLVTDLLRIYASVLHNDSVPGAGTKVVTTSSGKILRTFFKLIAYCRRDSVRWHHTAKVASCVLIDMAFRNPLVCDELVTHHYDNGPYSVLLVMPPYEAHWMQHILATGATNSGVRFLVTEEARADCHRFHGVG